MSVRGERIIYKERDSWDEPKKTYTTIRRYQVPDGSSSSVHRHDGDYKEEKIIIRREKREDSPPPPPSPPPPREDIEYRSSERVRDRGRDASRSRIDIRLSDRSQDPPRRDVTYKFVEREEDWDHIAYGGRSDSRFRERDLQITRAPSPPSPARHREYRFERDREFSPVYQHDRPYELERYSKSTEYFAQPQPIVIRESAPQPIIIREERREPQRIIIRREEPQYEMIEREEVKEDRSVVKREEPPSPAAADPVSSPSEKKFKQPEEDYFYERRIVERKNDRRRSGSNDRRTEIHPRDSASQYSSDDSYEYVRRERRVSGSREHSPHHKRHLAEGALAGIAAGEIIRHHKKSQGEKPPGRGRSLVGGAALGAVGAEALSRVRSMTRRGSRSRSRSHSSERRHHRRRQRSRSRSKSLSRMQQLGGLAAVAAVGALAGYAIKKGANNKETVVINDRGHRSRSRRRRASVDVYTADEGNKKALDPEHRNRRIAQAGLATAAVAGVLEKVRSRSRGAKGRSRSRFRQGVPIAAAGLGGAALAGLYEKNKANKEAKKEAIIAEEMSRGRRLRSRSHSRPALASNQYSDGRRSIGDDRDLIAYGHEPIYPDQHQYSDEEPGSYRRRHRGNSEAGSSPDTRGYRSRSRSRRWAAPAAAAGVGALAAHEVGRRRERSRQRDAYWHDGQDRELSPSPSRQPGYLPSQRSAYPDQQAYPSSNYFPPLPTGQYAQANNNPGAQTPYPPYNPADYANNRSQPNEYGNSHHDNHDNTVNAAGANKDMHDPNNAHPDYRGADRDPENMV